MDLTNAAVVESECIVPKHSKLKNNVTQERSLKLCVTFGASTTICKKLIFYIKEHFNRSQTCNGAQLQKAASICA